jgi:hypothetical protein
VKAGRSYLDRYIDIEAATNPLMLEVKAPIIFPARGVFRYAGIDVTINMIKMTTDISVLNDIAD